jgi:hypothetical protein
MKNFWGDDDEGDWSVFSEEARAEIERLKQEVNRLRAERRCLRDALFAARRWIGIHPRAEEMRDALEARDDAAEALDWTQVRRSSKDDDEADA